MWLVPRVTSKVETTDESAFAWQWLSCCPWPSAFPYMPRVRVGIAHYDICVHLRYLVHEQHIRARAYEPNGEVWKDSCVEFFVMPNPEDGIYYNFEFNCIGTTRVSAGQARKGRIGASLQILARVEVQSSLGKLPFEEQEGDLNWSLEVQIPKSCFFLHELPALSGLTMRANFYKCGDELTVPHYISWQPIDTPSPDFHRPEFFGEIGFE